MSLPHWLSLAPTNHLKAPHHKPWFSAPPYHSTEKGKGPPQKRPLQPFPFSFSRLAHRVATRPRDIIITPLLPIPSSSDCINSAMGFSRKSKLPQRNNLFTSGFFPCFFSETRVCIPTLFLFSSKWQKLEMPPPPMGYPERPP